MKIKNAVKEVLVSATKNTLLLTGLPRAGTTLCCHILNCHTNVLALHEPLTPTDFDVAAGKTAAVNYIRLFAANARELALTKGIALTRQKDGKVPENPVAEACDVGLRQMNVSLGEIEVGAQVQNEDFTLAIKHNALFTALLPELAEAFPVYGIVRNPLAVMASWNLVDLPVYNGHVPAGEMFSPKLQTLLANTPERITRQLHILEWFFAAFTEHLHQPILRYESFVTDPTSIGKCLGLKTEYVGTGQTRKSRNNGYDLELMEQLYRQLIHYGDAIWQFYSRDQVNELMEQIRSSV